MYKKKGLHIISLLLLTLMFFKVSALHVFTHDDNSSDKIENCKICDSAINNQTAEHDFSSTFSIETPITKSIETAAVIGKSQIFLSSKLHFRIFGRPPPSLI